MNPSFDSSKHPEEQTRYDGGDSESWPPMGSIELIDCEDEPASEAEVSVDPNRWTLPLIREGAAVALLVCVAPAFAACIAAVGTGTLALLSSEIDE